jgi:hypothetical protein
MPIEDVDFLLRNSVADSVLLFVDSSKRDRVHDKTAAQYVVRLDEAVKFVFGLDILDAAIPTTMYNVDSHNNELRFLTADARSGELKTNALFRAELEALSRHPLYDAAVADSTALRWLVSVSPRNFVSSGAGIEPVTANAPLSIPERLVFVRRTFEGIPLRPEGREPVDNASVFDLANAGGAVSADIVRLADPERNSELAAWLRANSISLNFSVVPSTVSRSASTYSGATDSSYSLLDIVYFDAFDVSDAVLQNMLAQAPGDSGVRVAAKLHFLEIEHGNYTISGLISYLQDKLTPLSLSVASSTDGAADKQNRVRFSAADNVMFYICSSYDSAKNAFVSSAATLLGFDDTRGEDACGCDTVFEPIFVGGGASSALPSCMSVRTLDAVSQSYLQVLVPPGVVNLAGPRFITLRCPEIEEHLSSVGRSSRYSTGIGVFKLASGGELTHLRFDFVSLVRKPFHPIGRLSRLSFRFELSDGTLYDFKGINHQILINIKYYVPVDKERGSKQYRTELNPDYDPNFLAVMLKAAPSPLHTDTEETEEDEEDEDEEDYEEDGGAHAGRGLQRMLMEHYLHDHFSVKGQTKS